MVVVMGGVSHRGGPAPRRRSGCKAGFNNSFGDAGWPRAVRHVLGFTNGTGKGTTMATIPLTLRGAELLKDELHRLKTVERPAVINSIAEARAQGDLSENAEYDAARERQGFIEGRIAELESKLSNAQIINPREVEADGRVVFGATVELEDLESGDKVTYQIVGEDEADLKQGKISVSSPIARALISRVAGDVATVLAPGGEREYEVLDVRYE